MHKNTPLNPRITLHKNGTATLSGIPHRQLRGLLCQASLFCYDEMKKPAHRADYDTDEDYERRTAEKARHYRESRYIIDAAEKNLSDKYHCKAPEKPLIERLRENNKLRQEIKAIMASVDVTKARIKARIDAVKELPTDDEVILDPTKLGQQVDTVERPSFTDEELETGRQEMIDMLYLDCLDDGGVIKREDFRPDGYETLEAYKETLARNNK